MHKLQDSAFHKQPGDILAILTVVCLVFLDRYRRSGKHNIPRKIAEYEFRVICCECLRHKIFHTLPTSLKTRCFSGVRIEQSVDSHRRTRIAVDEHLIYFSGSAYRHDMLRTLIFVDAHAQLQTLFTLVCLAFLLQCLHICIVLLYYRIHFVCCRILGYRWVVLKPSPVGLLLIPLASHRQQACPVVYRHVQKSHLHPVAVCLHDCAFGVYRNCSQWVVCLTAASKGAVQCRSQMISPGCVLIHISGHGIRPPFHRKIILVLCPDLVIHIFAYQS